MAAHDSLPRAVLCTCRRKRRMAMNRLLLVLGVLATSALLVPGDAEAQRGGRGGGPASGGADTAATSAARGWSVRRSAGSRPDASLACGPAMAATTLAGPATMVGAMAHGRLRQVWRRRGWLLWRPLSVFRRLLWCSGWGAAGLVTGSVIGAAAASTYPAYQTPMSSTVGGYCATTVRTCALSNAAPVGTRCSCRTQGGRARGTVVGG